MPAVTENICLTDRERELGAIISAYNEVTDRLKDAHERLAGEVVRLRQELEAKNEELRRQDRLAALGEMAAGLAHEVRNPLGGIALYSSMLERELVDRPKACGAASKISQNVRSLDRLVTEILAFAQEGHLERGACSLDRILTGVEDSICPWATEAQANVNIEAKAHQVRLNCDSTKLEQALTNLVLNGVQAAGHGGNVWLSATSDADEGLVQIDVWDNGPGIPTDKLDRIFNPFFTTKATGTGLGLAIVHRIVEAHGGTIRAVNRPEGGAKFTLRLPVGDIDDARLKVNEERTVKRMRCV